MILVLACFGLTRGQHPAPPPEPAKKADGKAPDPGKDPTKASPKLKEALAPTALGQGGTAATPRLPGLVLRGRIILKDRPPAALIEVDAKERPVLVFEGSAVTVGGLRLQVIEVGTREVRIEVQPLNEIIVLR
jgi:hypothetical protein